jgi:hypothetical protein
VFYFLFDVRLFLYASSCSLALVQDALHSFFSICSLVSLQFLVNCSYTLVVNFNCLHYVPLRRAGEQGTFKILRGSNECKIEGSVVAGEV